VPDRFLALDCATRTGWAFGAPGVLRSGCEVFPLRKGADPVLRVHEFRVWLDQQLDEFRPHVVVYELPVPSHTSLAQRDLSVGFVTELRIAAALHGIPYQGLAGATLKKRATGSGRADKALMIAAARRDFPQLGATLTDDNEADALLLLAWAQAGFPERERKPARKTSPRRKAQQPEPALTLVP